MRSAPPFGGVHRIVTASTTTLTPGRSMPKRGSNGNRWRGGSWGKPLLALPCGIRATARFEAVAIDPQGAARCRSQSMTNGRAQDRDASVALSPAFHLISTMRPSKITNESRNDCRGRDQSRRRCSAASQSRRWRNALAEIALPERLGPKDKESCQGKESL